jgi:hypothetical protein
MNHPLRRPPYKHKVETQMYWLNNNQWENEKTPTDCYFNLLFGEKR